MSEPIFSNLNSKTYACTWTWDATGSVAGFPSWFAAAPCGDFCGPGGTVPYPSFDGTVDGETTVTYCTA